MCHRSGFNAGATIYIQTISYKTKTVKMIKQFGRFNTQHSIETTQSFSEKYLYYTHSIDILNEKLIHQQGLENFVLFLILNPNHECNCNCLNDSMALCFIKSPPAYCSYILKCSTLLKPEDTLKAICKTCLREHSSDKKSEKDNCF